MDTQNTAPEYMLLFRGTDWDTVLSPEQAQQVMTRWIAWYEDIDRQGKLKGGQPLVSEGKLVSGKQGQTVADGPFAESKEAIGGYFLLQVDDLAEAVEIAKRCPALEYGLTVEVRPVAEQCSTMQRLGLRYERASART